MSELRVGRIVSSGTVTLSGITTFSGSSAILTTSNNVSASSTIGQTRFVSGDYATSLQFYNGTTWVII